MSDRHGPYGSGVLHLPTDLTIDPVAVDRLARQLATAPTAVIGVVAPVAELPAGSSTRVHAERRALLPLDVATDGGTDGTDETDGTGAAIEVTGAVLVRTGVEVSVGPDVVHLPPGRVRTDPGAVVHRRVVAPDGGVDADHEGRSPFPWRPVVLFLAAADDPATTLVDDLESLLDRLLDADVEPRLAARGIPGDARRHRPCAPTAATVERLAPDVIVALDQAALERAPGWCTQRGTVLVDMTGPAASGHDGIEMVPWQIDRHPTRLRARVSPTVAPGALAALVNRLAAGPQPAPPVDPGEVESTSSVAVELGDRHDRPRARARGVVVIGQGQPTGSGPRPLLDGLVDRLAVAGHDVRWVGADRATEVSGADVVLVPGPTLASTHALLATRATAGRPTVLVVDAVDGPIDAAGTGQVAGQGLVAVAADADAVEQLRARGLPTQLVPVMTTIARQEALRAAGEGPVASSGGVIGWTLAASAGEAPDPVGDALATGLIELLDDRPDLLIEVVTDGGAVPRSLADHPQVSSTRGRPDPGEQSRWTAHVLTAAPEPAPTSAVLTPLLEAAHAGVPTLLSSTAARAVGGLADARLVIDEPTAPAAWIAPLRLLLDRDDRPARSARARDIGEALERPEASDLVIARLLGWLDREGAR
ncbi:MAG: hypothetical protein ACXWCB_08135 [Acidimicrobiales bacterium]